MYPVSMITSIRAGFLSKLFCSQSFFLLYFHFESFSITFDWLEKSLDIKPAPIELKQKCLFGSRLFSSQSELFDNFSNCSDWLDKSRPSKKPFLFWSCKQATCRPANNHFNRGRLSILRLFSSQSKVINSRFKWSKQKWLFWRAGFFQPIRAFWKLFRLIKDGSPKKSLLFWSCKHAIKSFKMEKRKKDWLE